MIIERITAASEMRIPPEVLEALGLKPGDDIAFDVHEGVVWLRRVDFSDSAEIDADTGLDIATLRTMIQESIDDPRPTMSPAEAMASVRADLRARQERNAA